MQSINPLTVISVYPSIYVAFHRFSATDLCGQVGSRYNATTLSFAPNDLSTSMAITTAHHRKFPLPFVTGTSLLNLGLPPSAGGVPTLLSEVGVPTSVKATVSPTEKLEPRDAKQDRWTALRFADLK